MRKGKTYCSSDWHGCRVPAKKLLNYLQPEDTLYYLGDAIDRGNDGVELMNILMNRPNTIYLLGNHESMMQEYLSNIAVDQKAWIDSATTLWFSNGGDKTYSALPTDPDTLTKYYTYISKMPKEAIYTSSAGHTVILEHAGFSPFIGSYKLKMHDPLWDRDHFRDKWSTGKDYKGLNPETTYLVHGHTPVQYLQYEYGYRSMPEKETKKDFVGKRQFLQNIVLDGEEIIKPEVLRYCDNHKFCVDMCTIVSNRVALLDLDTFETTYFDSED